VGKNEHQVEIGYTKPVLNYPTLLSVGKMCHANNMAQKFGCGFYHTNLNE